MSFAMLGAAVSKLHGEDSPQTFFYASTTMDRFFETTSKVDEKLEAEQHLFTGRRQWKTLKGRSEAVWPPAAEAALLTALYLYVDNPRLLEKNAKRFPMRNRFISDFIFNETGKRRTPKQVSSRLQQLRDTCRDKKTLQLISARSSVKDLAGDCVSSIAQGTQASPCSSPDLHNSNFHPTSVCPKDESPPQLCLEHHSINAEPFIPVGQQSLFDSGMIHDHAAWGHATCGIDHQDMCCCCSFQNNTFEFTHLATSYHKNSTIRLTANPTYQQAAPAVNTIHHSFHHELQAFDITPTTRSTPELYNTSYMTSNMTSYLVSPSGCIYL